MDVPACLKPKDIEKVAAEVVLLAKEQPDRIANCVYTEDGETGECIVGCALERVGVDMLHLNNIGLGASELVSQLAGYTGRLDNELSEKDRQHLEFIRKAQIRQDDDDSWSEAVHEAVRYMSEECEYEIPCRND